MQFRLMDWKGNTVETGEDEVTPAPDKRKDSSGRIYGYVGTDNDEKAVYRLWEAAPGPTITGPGITELRRQDEADKAAKSLKLVTPILPEPTDVDVELHNDKVLITQRSNGLSITVQLTPKQAHKVALAMVEAGYGTKVYVSHCTDCKQTTGSQHLPSCHRQGLVTPTSDYKGNLKETDVEQAGTECVKNVPQTVDERPCWLHGERCCDPECY